MIRIYGHAGGENSFAQVTRGMIRAATKTQHFAGFMPIDRVPGDDDPVPPGASAAVALHCGVPTGVITSHTQGRHRRHYLILAPNSNGIPPRIREMLVGTISTFEGGDVASRQRPLLDGLLAPSTWGAEVLRRAFDDVAGRQMSIGVARHGVDPDVFCYNPDVHATRKLHYAQGQFRVLHFTSTLGERKGTEQLLKAWRQVRHAGALPTAASLAIIVNPLAFSDYQWLLRDLGLKGENVRIVPNPQAPADDVARALRWAHAVVQPSRAEGFGLLPLEARAVGTPVCATLCTGHSEHMSESTEGLVVVQHGPDGPVDDYEGATAPTVEQDAVAMALTEMYDSWLLRAQAARLAAAEVCKQWSWERVSSGVLGELDSNS